MTMLSIALTDDKAQWIVDALRKSPPPMATTRAFFLADWIEKTFGLKKAAV